LKKKWSNFCGSFLGANCEKSGRKIEGNWGKLKFFFGGFQKLVGEFSRKKLEKNFVENCRKICEISA